MAEAHAPQRRGARSRKSRRDLHEIDDDEAFVAEIAARHRITSPWFNAALAAVLEMDVPPVRRLKPTDPPTRQKGQAPHIYEALLRIDKLCRDVDRWTAPAIGTLAYPSNESSYCAWKLVMAAEQLGKILSPSPLNWLAVRLPRIDPELLELFKAEAELRQPDRRTIPKRDLQQQILVQLLAVIVMAADGSAHITSGADRKPSLFQETCWAVASRLYRRRQESPQLMIDAHKSALGSKKAFCERVANIIKNKVGKAHISDCLALMKKSPLLPEDVRMDIDNFMLLLMGPPNPDLDISDFISQLMGQPNPDAGQ
jgi:hypothetical protein